MKTSACRRLAFAALALSLSASAYAQPMQWWKSESAQQQIGLATDQAAKIDTIFQASMVDLRREKDELDKVEDKLSHLIETNADEAMVTWQIDHVEMARAALNKTRTLMLLHMRQVLTPEQRTKLNAMRDRTDKDQDNRGRGPGAQPRPGPRKDGNGK